MAAVQRKLVHKQFNSPMGLYSQQNVKETLNRELKAFGSEGIEIDEQIARPLNLANSAVLRAVEEEEQMKCGYKRVAWPPASEERIVREFTPQPQTQYQPAPAYNHQPSAGAAATAVPPAQGPIYNNVPHQTPKNTNNNNFARETHSPYAQNAPTQTEVEQEAFPPQTPETPIILKDKMFSRLASQEPNPTYQQHEQQPQYPQQQQQQHYSNEQPKYQQQQQQYYPHEQPQCQQQHPQHYPQQQYQQQPQPAPYYQQQYQQQPQQHQPQEQSYNHPSGWKPIRPPQSKPEHIFTGAPKESNPPVATPIYQQQFQNYHQPQQQYRAPSYDNYQQHQPQYQAQAPTNQYQAQPHAGAPYQQHAPSQQYQQQQQPAWVQQQQQQYQQPPWVQQQQPQSQNQSPLNQYNQAPHYQPQQQQYPPHQQQNQFVPQTNQQQFNSYSQPQQQQHTVSHDQVDQQPQVQQNQRGASPGIITLRKEAPITQKPAPVYTSQPAAVSYRESSNDGSVGGSSMRGDLKWPPPEYKEAAAKENEERRKLALGPVCRPRKVHRDYTSFFAKNALSHHYPSYKVPPGTQHMTC